MLEANAPRWNIRLIRQIRECLKRSTTPLSCIQWPAWVVHDAAKVAGHIRVWSGVGVEQALDDRVVIRVIAQPLGHRALDPVLVLE